MPTSSFYNATPVDAIVDPQQAQALLADPSYEQEARSYVIDCRNKLRSDRILKKNLWDECWMLYRGQEDWSDKQDWQSRIFIPKAWNSVKQATQSIKRLLLGSKDPWSLEAVNPDDLVGVVRAEQATDLVKVFMENANWLEAFGEGLECGFIIGVGVWKVWWGLHPRTITQVEQSPQGLQTVQREMLEGRLFIKAVDPYNFYWLHGSRMNNWVGTVEDIEIPKWELQAMAEQGIFGPEGLDKVRKLGASRLDRSTEQTNLRFNEPAASRSPSSNIKLTDYYGPLLDKDQNLLTPYGHMLIANDDVVLTLGVNKALHRKPPYVAFSPLSLPFRTEGVGIVEMVRSIDRTINLLTNMSVDTMRFKLVPTFEVAPEAYENSEDFETGLIPGKVFRRNVARMDLPGIQPVQLGEGVSQDAMAIQGQLDRAHQEGALVSEIQQALPRYRGVQTATEIEAKDANQQSFFGSVAADIESQALRPLVEICWELIFQYIDTANDPRVASILGVGADVLRGMTRQEIQEAIQGDYKIKVTGITQQLEKHEILQQLVQFMNIIGQNAEEWGPYINKSALLRRIMECFRPAIRDEEQLVADPATVEAMKVASSQQQLAPEVLRMLPTLVDMAVQQQQQAAAAQAEAQQQQMQLAETMLRLKAAELDLEKKQADIDLTKAKAKAEAAPHKHSG